MINILLVSLYVIFAVLGSTLVKLGGVGRGAGSWLMPIINISISLQTLLGIVLYGLSFVLYIILLNKFDLSFISPLTIGIVYILLMITAVVVFGESFTIIKIIGCSLILAGVLMIAATSK